MRNRDQQKKPNWIGIAVLILLVAPGFAIPLAVIAAVVYLSKNASKPTSSHKTTYSRQATAFDDCPKSLFCFHKDKGEHHLARGKEIDPWDRPDIDISKYQRRK